MKVAGLEAQVRVRALTGSPVKVGEAVHGVVVGGCEERRRGVTTYKDKEVTCAECGDEFVWSARDQEFYAEKGYQALSRCKPCKQASRLVLQKKGGKEGEAEP